MLKSATVFKTQTTKKENRQEENKQKKLGWTAPYV
jgi:hypothetical protein